MVDMSYFMSDIRVLMTTKYLENLHRDGPLSKYSIAKYFLLQAVHMILKCPLKNFFWITPYLHGVSLRLPLKKLTLFLT